jgi:hypothetical protein
VGLPFRVRGDYFESCNCEAICPCRKVGDVMGGRSTYGICFGLLSWRIVEGDVSGVDVSGLNAALSCRYDDDEPGSPWTVILHVDERGDGQQRRALSYVFLEGIGHLPWIRKQRHLVGVEPGAIEIDGTNVRVGTKIGMRATRPFVTDRPVACGIPGYERKGQEMYADELRVWDEVLSGNCAFASDFDYESR